MADYARSSGYVVGQLYGNGVWWGTRTHPHFSWHGSATPGTLAWTNWTGCSAVHSFVFSYFVISLEFARSWNQAS